MQIDLNSRQSLIATVTDKSYVTLRVIVGRIKGSRNFSIATYMASMHVYCRFKLCIFIGIINCPCIEQFVKIITGKILAIFILQHCVQFHFITGFTHTVQQLLY